MQGRPRNHWGSKNVATTGDMMLAETLNSWRYLAHSSNSMAGGTYNSGHGTCESVVAIHSSQHAVPEVKIDHPLVPKIMRAWYLSTRLIAANHPTTGRIGARSTTGYETPSSACTRRPDEIGADGFSSSSWSEQIPATRSGGGGGLFREEGAATFRVRV
ncbi:hypothetical protein F511_28486 [Dorcoceras hygrometricum]|uniref:Uncharacterized protein n=1 Tax=Dorcoceras hygrometricum TaxID=472368 RepID=A0A2Z7A530_9LAMI|nr:hypothetical protein F511_28486 [Dorcoceras hygrometricum]